jgi:hypothetical protein
MKNSEQFLAAFNSIEKMLKHFSKSDQYIPFQRLIDIVGKTNAVVRKYRDDLKELADLRNAIVHETTHPNYAIAEPHDTTVDKIKHIENEMAEPKKVIPLFSRKETTKDEHPNV